MASDHLRSVFVGFAITLTSSGVVPELAAQGWNDARTLALVSQATDRRARQLADTGLRDYTATARGFLTFLAQVGEGFPDPPKIVKADELALEVYWHAPNHSKQIIVGRRDSTLLPTDIQYHRDHLGIVQNNFPGIIRLGEGDEVRDVPHPLSASGMEVYEYAISDSLRIQIPGRTIDVYEVKLRPRDDRTAAAVGAVYLAREDAQVVRMAFSFTRAALIDRQLEDVSIVLDNSLMEERFWLPRRQEIEIRRTGTWLEFPARGIIRGRWEICCYVVNRGTPVTAFTGPEIEFAPPARRAAHRWEGSLMEVLPSDVRAATDEDVRRIQSEVRELVRAEALARSRQTTVTAPALSELARINRAEGLSLGLGVRRRLGAGLDVAASGRFGLADHEAKGSVSAGWRNPSGAGIRLRLFREYRDARDMPEASGLRNSITAQELAIDYTEPFDARGLELAFEWAWPSADPGLRWRLLLAREHSDSVAVAARPSRRSYPPTIPATPGNGRRVSIAVQRTPAPLLGGVGQFEAELRIQRIDPNGAERTHLVRGWGLLELGWQLGEARLRSRSTGGVLRVEGATPAQAMLYAGGPTSAPGYSSHRFVASRLLSQRIEWEVPIPFPAVSLGRWGSVPGQARIVPFLTAVYVGGAAPFRESASGWYPSAGLGLVTLFDLLRFDVARGLREGRWILGVDITRDFWRIL